MCRRLAHTGADEFNPYSLQHLERGQAIVRSGSDDASRVEIPTPPKGRGNVSAIKKQSRLHYGVPRERVERNIFKVLGAKACWKPRRAGRP